MQSPPWKLVAVGFEQIRNIQSSLQVPLADVLKKALELRGRPHELLVKSDPFAGLASQRPARAFAALTKATKLNDYSPWAWKTFLNADKRKSDKPRFMALIAERISRLPTSALVEIVHSVSDWLYVSSKVLLEKYPIQFENAVEEDTFHTEV